MNPFSPHRGRQPVWRLSDGRAVLVAEHVYRGPRNEYGKIPDTWAAASCATATAAAPAAAIDVLKRQPCGAGRSLLAAAARKGERQEMAYPR